MIFEAVYGNLKKFSSLLISSRKLMKFDGALFAPYIDQKIFKNRGLSSKAIGIVEIHWIWHSLSCTSTTTSPRENLSESEDIPNSNIDELSIKHMNLTESTFENIFKSTHLYL